MIACAALAPQLASADTSSGTISGMVTNDATGVAVQGGQVDITNLGTGGLIPPSVLNFVYQHYPDKSNAAAAQTVAVTAAQATSHADASLATGATISGTVTAAVGGAPVSDVRVYVPDYGGGYPNYVPITFGPPIRMGRGASPACRPGSIKSSSTRRTAATTPRSRWRDGHAHR